MKVSPLSGSTAASAPTTAPTWLSSAIAVFDSVMSVGARWADRRGGGSFVVPDCAHSELRFARSFDPGEAARVAAWSAVIGTAQKRDIVDEAGEARIERVADIEVVGFGCRLARRLRGRWRGPPRHRPHRGSRCRFLPRRSEPPDASRRHPRRRRWRFRCCIAARLW